MIHKEIFGKPINKIHPFFILLIGGICLTFSQGRWSITLATFGYFISMLYFFRVTKGSYNFLLFLLIHSIGWDIAYSGLIPAPFLWRWIIAVSFSLLMGLLFLADVWAVRKKSSFYTSFLFPSGLVFLEYFVGTYGTGTGTSVAYTFSNQLAFTQLASITGWTGISFMVAWASSVIVRFFYKNTKKTYRELLYFGAIFAIILIFGHSRLWYSYKGKTVRVAAIVGESTLPEEGALSKQVLRYLKEEKLPKTPYESAKKYVKKIINKNFQLAEQELKAGAKIVVFPEASPVITKAEERYCNEYAQQLAIKYDAYFGLGYYIFHRQDSLQKDENKFVFIASDGKKIWEYFKSKLVPGSNHKVGKGILPTHLSPYGTLSAAICYDMDFPRLMQQAGKQKAAIVFGPSNDWEAIRELHVRMATMRAIEQGYSLVRPTGGGISLVTDPYGRFIAYQNTITSGEHIMVADVFTKGVTTIYNRIGDLFSYLCVFTFLLMSVLLLFQRNSK